MGHDIGMLRPDFSGTQWDVRVRMRIEEERERFPVLQ
jgi:hypothetical protein